MNRLKIVSLTAATLFAFSGMAREIPGLKKNQGTAASHKTAAACAPATSQVELDVNNIRARLMNGGDMWWDLVGDPRYEVPKIQPGSGQPSVHSLFAGALWIGGIDAGGQLKVAAQTYRQSGNDFWPGPLEGGTTDDAICSVYDRHWKVIREEIDEQINLGTQYDVANGGTIPLGLIPKSIVEWPAAGNPHAIGAKNTPLTLSLTKDMAPYEDVDGNPGYDPEHGDYPDVFGDQAIWWIYNDRGDVHTETGGEAIGLELQTLAFAFATNDEINDMTFYKYTVRNFSTSAVDSVFFGQWTDGDLGLFTDDYVGCDTSRELGILYNGDAIDEGITGYGTEIPLIGIDFFQGPRKQVGLDSLNNPVYDTLGMAQFTYYNNDFSVIGNPEVASHYYGYLSGSWKDGSLFTAGGNAYQTGAPTNYMFPDDPSQPLPAWSECSENNTPADRRFVQSAGPFRLDPGAFNEVVVGAVWVRQSAQVGCQADFDLLRGADDKAQALFDNNFKVISGPDAPFMDIRELDREIVIALRNGDNPETFNNVNEQYEEEEPVICAIVADTNVATNGDCTYNFQGYKIFQLKNATVSASEFDDPDKARLIAQVDIEDDVDKLVNLEFDLNLGADVPTLMVNGENKGIRHTFRVTEDAFATGDKKLVNFKTYYFSVVAYADNNYLPYDPADPKSQRKPYLEGRKNIKTYSAIPHKPDPENGGTTLNTIYGDGPEITRIEGEGNGGNAVDLTPASAAEILSNGSMAQPVYARGAGPVDVKVYDPTKVPNADFELTFSDTAGGAGVLNASSNWTLTNLTTGEEWNADRTIASGNEQLIPELGLSINIAQTGFPGPNNAPTDNGFIESSITYADPGQTWLSSVPDADGNSFFNWIRSGAYDEPDYGGAKLGGVFLDSLGFFSDVVNATWAPFALLGGMSSGAVPYMPLRLVNGLAAKARIDSTASVDLVLTSDKSKWTRCAVIEMTEDAGLSEGGRDKLELRDHASLNLDGTYDGSDRGRSWFPGYAINVETGKRLNIIFSEDSWLVADGGNDMIWNPTDNLFTSAGPNGFDIRNGGKHFIFIMNSAYDEGLAYQQILDNPSTSDLRNTYGQGIWGSMAMTANGFAMKSFADGLIPTETTIKLRTHMPYRRKAVTGENGGVNKYEFSTNGLAPTTNDNAVASSALDLIRVVPNPYYAYSTYEKSQLDNRVKITNLPPQCEVTIYAPDGTVVRKFNRDVAADVSEGNSLEETNLDTSIDWDLKNNKNIPVGSGLYIIHVQADGVGEKVVKWFGVMRPIDLDTF